MFSDTRRLAAAQVLKRATRSLLEKPIPREQSRRRRKEQREGYVSCRCGSFGLDFTFECVSDSTGVGGKLNAVQVARPRQLDYEFLLHPPRMRRKKQDPITQTNRFADVVSDKDNGLAPRFPNTLEITIKLLAGKSIESGERLIHQKDAWIRREGAGQRGALFHPAGKLVNVGAFKSR